MLIRLYSAIFSACIIAVAMASVSEYYSIFVLRTTSFRFGSFPVFFFCPTRRLAYFTFSLPLSLFDTVTDPPAIAPATETEFPPSTLTSVTCLVC
ncbi:hypothetical protein C8R41DRAFT_603926 [Lentinula lateritia]|uniref:Secreted protein n=1 Tax=Lentinula lateritia TaxID=40482 RepID=A0ABQ8V2M5_9AGAR|nr:hypothetical protein C8R41DRAFT_603926 [Lentinula lateritia]